MVKRVVPQPFTSNAEGYSEYLLSPHWRNTRNSALALAGYCCADCGATDRLEVHHLHYDSVGHENIETDLRVLCHDCHQEEHTRPQWRRTRNGNWMWSDGDNEIVVFERESGGYGFDEGWVYVRNGVFSDETYGSRRAAMRASGAGSEEAA